MRYFVCLFLLFEFLIGNGQQIKLSPEFKIGSRVEKAQIIGKTSSGIVVRKMGTEEYLELYSPDLKLIKSKLIETNGQNIIRTEIVADNIVYYFLNNFELKSAFKVSVYANDLDAIVEQRILDSFDIEKNESAKNFRMVSSQGALFSAVVHSIEHNDNLERIDLVIVNLNSELEYKRSIPIEPVQSSKLVVRKCLIDMSGNVFVVVEKTMSDGTPVEESKPFIIYKISKDGDVKTMSFTLDREIFDLPKFNYDFANNKIVINALINAIPSSEKGSTGILTYRIDAKDLIVESKNYAPYPKSFIAELTHKDINFVQEKLLTFKIKEVALSTKGDPLVVVESFFQTSERVAVMGNSFSNINMTEYKNVNVYSFNDLVVFWIDSSNSIGQSTIIRKKQVTEDDGGIYSSYIMSNSGTKLQFVHTDIVSNNVDLVLQSVDEFGKIEKKILMADIEKSNPLIVKMGKQISLNELLIPSFRNNYFKLLKVNFF